MRGLSDFFAGVNSVLWGPAALCAYVLTGLAVHFRTGFFIFTRPQEWLKRTVGRLFSDRSVREGHGRATISQFQSFATMLASCLGTGNIIGVATAVASGGPGSVFWIWVASLFSMGIAYAENSLGTRYRVRTLDGGFAGGPMFYISRGLGSRAFAGVYCLCCVIASFGIGSMTQANAIAQAAGNLIGASPAATGAVLFACVAAVVLGGVRRVARVAEKVVPVMALGYIAGGVWVIASNAARMPDVISMIFGGAFTVKAAAGGAAGWTMAQAMRYGVSRGVFSNEAGLGTSPMACASSDNADPVTAGMWGVAQVFIDTVVMCTVSAFVILLGSQPESLAGAGGEQLVYDAFGASLPWGGDFVAVSVILFAFTSIIGWSVYGAGSFSYLFGSKASVLYKLAFSAAAFAGCVFPLRAVWEISDAFNALMAVPNLAALILLAGRVDGPGRGPREKSAKKE